MKLRILKEGIHPGLSSWVLNDNHSRREKLWVTTDKHRRDSNGEKQKRCDHKPRNASSHQKPEEASNEISP